LEIGRQARMREPHRARQPVLTGIEELIHQILGY
jgi:hypothetical protein